MKKIILMVVAMVMTVGIAEMSASEKKTKVTTVESAIFITDIDCDHCEKKVMNYMPTQKGIKEVKVDLPKKLITVSYDSSKSSEKAIIKLFKKIDVTAEVYTPKPTHQTQTQPTQQAQTQPTQQTQATQQTQKR